MTGAADMYDTTITPVPGDFVLPASSPVSHEEAVHHAAGWVVDHVDAKIAAPAEGRTLVRWTRAVMTWEVTADLRVVYSPTRGLPIDV